MVQTSVENYQEEQSSLWRQMIQYAVLLVAGLFLAILVTAFIPGLSSTAHAAERALPDGRGKAPSFKWGMRAPFLIWGLLHRGKGLWRLPDSPERLKKGVISR